MANGSGVGVSKSWIIGILVTMLLGIGAFAGRNVFGSGQSLQERVNCLEKNQVRQDEAIVWIKAGIEDIKVTVGEIKDEVKKK